MADLGFVIGTIVQVAQLAGAIIRDVVDADEQLEVVNKGVDKESGTDTKFDPQTVADRRAQRFIWLCIRQEFPNIRIIAEEGDEDEVESQPDDFIVDGLVKQFNNSPRVNFMSGPEVIEKDITVWIDPLDGTKEFVSGRFSNVTTLIGISMNGEAVAGVISEPFHKEERVTFGARGRGVWYCLKGDEHIRPVPPQRKGDSPARYSTEPVPAVVSYTRFSNVTRSAFEHLLSANIVAPNPIMAGGAGCKFLYLLYGIAAIWVFPISGCSLWDTCGGEALLAEMGGRSSDKFGNKIIYNPDGDMEVKNGIVACSSSELLDRVIPKVSVVDIIGEKFLDDPGWIPNSNVWRGRHGAVVFCLLSDGSRRAVKRVNRSVLPSRSEEKWNRDLNSYHSEFEFVDWIQKTKLPCAKLFTAERNCEKKFFDFQYDFEQIMGRQLSIHRRTEILQSVRWLSALHREESGPEFSQSNGLGTFWHPNAMKHINVTINEAINHYIKEIQTIHLNPKQFEAAFTKAAERWNLRMKTAAVTVHGDFKGANIFVGPFDPQPAALPGGDGVVPIDFQWSGKGLAAADLIYYIAGSTDILYGNDMQKALLAEMLSSWAAPGEPDEQIVADLNACLILYAKAALCSQAFSRDAAWFMSGVDDVNRCWHNTSLERSRVFFTRVTTICVHVATGVPLEDVPLLGI